MTAKVNKGIVFKMGPSTPSITLAGVTSVTPAKIKRDAVDATDHDSTAEEYIPDGIFGLTPITVVMNYVAGSATDDACNDAVIAAAAYAISYTVNAATGSETVTLSGVAIEYGPEDKPVRGKQTATMVIQPTGTKAQAPSA